MIGGALGHAGLHDELLMMAVIIMSMMFGDGDGR